jgi:hypothetical protein
MFLLLLEIAAFLVALTCTALWIAYPSQSYESWAALFGLLGGGLEFYRRWAAARKRDAPLTPSLTEHDKNLIANFRALFAESGLIRYYRETDFMLPFKQTALAPLYTFVETWNDEQHRFNNPELRAALEIFSKAATDLADEVVRYTVPDGRGHVTVLTRGMDPESPSEEVRNEAKAIDAKVPAFIEAHEKLVALCNRLA